MTDNNSLLERLRELLAAAGPEPWCVYSELDVGLPPSIFAGTPGQSGFEPVNPDSGWYLDFVVAAKNALPGLLAIFEQQATEIATAKELLHDAQYHLRADSWAEQWNQRCKAFLSGSAPIPDTAGINSPRHLLRLCAAYTPGLSDEDKAFLRRIAETLPGDGGEEGFVQADREVVNSIARAVMCWAKPHLKHMVAFSTLCEAIEFALPAPTRHGDEVRAALRKLLDETAYEPGDCPVVPVKYNELRRGIEALLASPIARPSGEGQFVEGPVSSMGGGWKAEIQIVGGHEVFADAYGETEQQAIENRTLILASLLPSSSDRGEG